MSDNITLNSSETEKVISNLTNYETDMENSLSDMSDIMVRISSVMNGELFDSILKKFSEFESQFPTINSNIQSYVNDFRDLVVKFSEKDTELNTGEALKAKEGGELVNVRY